MNRLYRILGRLACLAGWHRWGPWCGEGEKTFTVLTDMENGIEFRLRTTNFPSIKRHCARCRSIEQINIEANEKELRILPAPRQAAERR